MRIWSRRAAGLALSLTLLAVAACSGAPEAPSTASAPAPTTAPTGTTGPLSRQQQVDLAAEAFVFGQPLVITRRTMQTFAGAGPLNTMLHGANLATPQSRAVVAPNRDTLYLFAPIDVTNEPLVLQVPEVKDRYFSIQFLDAYTDVHDYVGTRTDGGAAGTYLVTAPGYSGPVPPGTRVITMPTPEGVLLGRVRVRNDGDLDAARAISQQVTLAPLATFLGQPDTAATVTLGPPPGTPQTTAAAGVGFFDELGDALAANPPTTDAQRQLVDRLAAIGVGPGLHPSTTATGDATQSIYTDGIKQGQDQIAGKTRELAAHMQNGWRINTDLGQYGDDLALRAAVAQSGWGANAPEEAVYPQGVTDGDGQPLTGAKRYVLHFDAGKLPPVQDLGFWSLTVYTPDRFLVDNPINRYSVGGDTPGLVTNPDGSLDLYLQHDAPTGHDANWLPTPAGPFSLSLRLYLPQASATDGSYGYPPLRAAG
jgi:hypothetical protein